MVSGPVANPILGIVDIFIVEFILWRSLSEFSVPSCDGEFTVRATAPLAGGGVSGSGNVTNGSFKSSSAATDPSL